MRLASKGRNSLGERLAFACFRLRKRLRQRRLYRPGQAKRILFVVGCQRSGTTLLSHVFKRDLDAVTYDEMSILSDRDRLQQLRLNPDDEVAARLHADRAPLVVLKPLVESQNVRRLLDRFPDSRAVWLYRDFRGVAASSLAFFSPEIGREDLAPLLGGAGPGWKTEHQDPATVATVRELAARTDGPHDAAVLFWYARNSLYFTRGCDRDDRILPCRYEDLVRRPHEVMTDLYAFLGRPYPGDGVLRDIVGTSAERGRDLPLHAEVERICGELLARLDACPRCGVRDAAIP